jgi:hypothetical protein
MFLIMASFIMGRVDSTCEADKSLQYIWMLLPSFSVGYGFVKVCVLFYAFFYDTVGADVHVDVSVPAGVFGHLARFGRKL